MWQAFTDIVSVPQASHGTRKHIRTAFCACMYTIPGAAHIVTLQLYFDDPHMVCCVEKCAIVPAFLRDTGTTAICLTLRPNDTVAALPSGERKQYIVQGFFLAGGPLLPPLLRGSSLQTE